MNVESTEYRVPSSGLRLSPPYSLLATRYSLLPTLVLCLLLVVLAGCDSVAGSGERVRVVVTPVDTPTATPLAAPTAAPVTYVVKAGDTLSGIAALFGVSVDDIVRASDISDPNVLSEGQVLTIPGRSTEGTPTGPSAGTPSAETTPAGPLGSPTLPPPDVTPPLGPTAIPESDAPAAP